MNLKSVLSSKLSNLNGNGPKQCLKLCRGVPNPWSKSAFLLPFSQKNETVKCKERSRARRYTAPSQDESYRRQNSPFNALNICVHSKKNILILRQDILNSYQYNHSDSFMKKSAILFIFTKIILKLRMLHSWNKYVL